MSDHIRLKKGLNLPVSGEALCKVTKTVSPDIVAVKPSDFRGVIPRLLVKEGDSVKAGTPLFADKNNPQVVFASPVSGVVDAVVRGDKRKLLAVTVKSDGQNDAIHFDAAPVEKLDRNAIVETLLASGVWPCIKQRPYGTVANPAASPKAIFISAMPTAPLAAETDFTLASEMDAFQAGVDVLARLTEGGVHLSLTSKSKADSAFGKVRNAVIHTFEGPHPAGNVGVQINHICPINKGETVWTVDCFLVPVIGRLFLKGVYDSTRTIAVAGPAAKNPSYVTAPAGISMKEIAEYIDGSKGDVRVISGDILSGENIGADGFLGFYNNQVSLLPEGNYYEMFGWCKPFRFKKFSFSRSYWSWLMPKSRKYAMDTNLNGGPRAFVVSDTYGKVLPMDIYPVYLFKAILAGNIEKMEELGIYEIIEEDVALCEYVDPSKNEIQAIVSDGIELMMKEMA